MACNLIAEAAGWLESTWQALDWTRSTATTAGVFALVAAAEFGDKSQLVCMTLASRHSHHHRSVLLGALAAFGLLNAVATAFGALAGAWLPRTWVSGGVALLFAGFGLHALFSGGHDDGDDVQEKSGHGVFLTTFLMIFLAEFGDKTQIAVAGLGAAEAPAAVWLGSTLALGFTSAVGIWAGRALLGRVSGRGLHVAGGMLFLLFALLAVYETLPAEVRSGLSGWIGAAFPGL